MLFRGSDDGEDNVTGDYRLMRDGDRDYNSNDDNNSNSNSNDNEPDIQSFSLRLDNIKSRLQLPVEIFDEFLCSSESIQILINLTTVLDCLQLFGASSERTSGIITYSSHTAIFKLSLEEAGIMTTCELSTLYSNEYEDMDDDGLYTAFLSSQVESQIILKSDALREAVQEIMDVYGAGAVALTISKEPDSFKLSTKGILCVCEIAFPRDCDAFVSFRCSCPAVVQWTYPLLSLQLGMKALGIATETYLRINEDGIACVQHQILLELESPSRGQEVFIDFLMVSEETADLNSDSERNTPSS